MTHKDPSAHAAKLLSQHWNLLSTHGTPLTMFIDDCLAPFGFPLDYVQTEAQRKVLFELGTIYAEYVQKNPWGDFFSSIHPLMTSKWHTSALGQFFTPSSVSDLMAGLTIGDKAELQAIIERDGLVTFHEPCVGAGGMLMSVCRKVDDYGLLDKAAFHCIDVDITCVRMCLLQFAANRFLGNSSPAALGVYHGNALGDKWKLYGGWNDLQSKSDDENAGALPVGAGELQSAA